MKPINAGEYILDASKATPSAAAATAVSAGYTLQDWVAIVTIIYTVLMAAHLVYKFARERAEDHAERKLREKSAKQVIKELVDGS